MNPNQANPRFSLNIMDKLPYNTLDLLKALEEEYPDKVVTKEMSAYQQGRLHGVIDLIRRLRKLETGDD